METGVDSEFRYKSCEHSDLASGAILRKMFVLTLFPELPFSFFQEQVPKMDSSPNVPSSRGGSGGGAEPLQQRGGLGGGASQDSILSWIVQYKIAMFI